MFPCERVKISEENFNNILKNNDVVYASGSTGEQIYVIKVNK
jgi:phage antirepressor YoqD-like protein